MEFYYNSNMAIHTEWKCPACGALLAMEDVNMAADMVLCRSCNKISKFSEIVQEERDEEILDSIPRRMSVTKTAGNNVQEAKRCGTFSTDVFNFLEFCDMRCPV